MGDKGVKLDIGKIQYDLVPPEALKALAEVLTLGAIKYPAIDNWKFVDNAKSRYTSALMRHLEAWRAGEINDPESGLPHLSHVICNAAFLIGTEEKHK